MGLPEALPATSWAERMTDRLTDEQLDEIVEDAQRAAVVGGQDFWPLRLIAELREARALIAALNAEGCPGRDAEEPDAVPIPGGEIRAAVGQQECVYCGGKEILSTLEAPMLELAFAHRPMEDGSPCLWERISNA